MRTASLIQILVTLLLLKMAISAQAEETDAILQKATAEGPSHGFQIGYHPDGSYLFAATHEFVQRQRLGIEYSYRKEFLTLDRLGLGEAIYLNYQNFLTTTLYLDAGVQFGHHIRNVATSFAYHPGSGEAYKDWGTFEQFDAGIRLGFGQEWQWARFVLNLEYLGFIRQFWSSDPKLSALDSINDRVKEDIRQINQMPKTSLIALAVKIGLVL
jgi:hypothetical protein